MVRKGTDPFSHWRDADRLVTNRWATRDQGCETTYSRVMEISADLMPQFDAQITLELSSAIVYQQLAVEMDVHDLPGMASWMRMQADEEMVHFQKFIKHCLDRGSHPTIGATAAPDLGASVTPREAFAISLRHEQKVSASIRALYQACEAAGDLDSRPLLNWFVDEQIEEESTVSGILARIDRVGGDGSGLLRLDDALGLRTGPTDSVDGD